MPNEDHERAAMDNVIGLQRRTVAAPTPLPDGMLAFRSLSGHEAVSQLFELDVDLVSPTPSLDLKQLPGKPLALDFQAASGIRRLHGHITRCKLAGREGPTSRVYRYRASVAVVPDPDVGQQNIPAAQRA